MVWTSGRMISLVILGLISVVIIFFIGRKLLRRITSAKSTAWHWPSDKSILYLLKEVTPQRLTHFNRCYYCPPLHLFNI